MLPFLRAVFFYKNDDGVPHLPATWSGSCDSHSSCRSAGPASAPRRSSRWSSPVRCAIRLNFWSASAGGCDSVVGFRNFPIISTCNERAKEKKNAKNFVIWPSRLSALVCLQFFVESLATLPPSWTAPRKSLRGKKPKKNAE